MQYHIPSALFFRRSFLTRYSLALLTVTLALPATFALHRSAPDETFLFFLAAVLITASWAGSGPALAALVLVLPLCAYYFLDPADSFAVNPSGVYALLAFTSVAAFLIAVTETLRVARGRAEAAYEQVEEARKYSALLCDVSRALIALPDTERALHRAANLIAADFAVWCILDLFQEDNQGKQRLHNVCIAHQNAAQTRQADALHNVYPWDSEATESYARRVRSGSLQWAYTADQVTPAFLQSVTRNREHSALLQSLDIVSFLCLPLRVGDSVLGTITLLSCKPKGEYKVQDIDAAQELALRLAQTVHNRAELLTHSAVPAVRKCAG